MKRHGSLLADLVNMDVLLGLLIGIAASFIVVVSMQHETFKEYQELIAGSMALIGAAGAVVAVMYQIRHTQNIEDERRNRQMYAARSMMPHALSSLCEYAESCCAELRNVLGDARPPHDPEQVKLPDFFSLARVSDLQIEPLQQLLQFGEPEVQDRISELMRSLQIQQSRLNNRGFFVANNLIFARQYYTLIANTLEIYARASKFFSYARGREQEVPAVCKDDISSAAFSCGFDPEWRDLQKYIDKDWRPMA
jgi:hypothetical protein